MNKEQFVDAIKIAVGQATENDIKSTLEKPIGRNPDERQVELSNWYKNLSALDKDNLHKVIKQTVDTCLFGTLCVIDGVRAIENSSDKGELNLEYRKGSNVTTLNDPKGMYLHDIYKS